jgi:hypothetical protein
MRAVSLRGSGSVPYLTKTCTLSTKYCFEPLRFHAAASLPERTISFNRFLQIFGQEILVDRAILLWDPHGWAGSYYH